VDRFPPVHRILAERIAKCRACPRLDAYLETQRHDQPSWWNRPVPGFGDRQARLLVLGLAPGRAGANRTGRPFTGPIGTVSPDRLEAYALHALGRGELPRANGHRPANGSANAQSGGTTAARPVSVTDATFPQEVLNSPLPVVVDFWAPWCAPCRAVAPARDRLAADYGGKVKIAKVNVDENQRYAAQYGVQSIPTLRFVRNGQVGERVGGAPAEPILRQRVRLFAGQ